MAITYSRLHLGGTTPSGSPAVSSKNHETLKLQVASSDLQDVPFNQIHAKPAEFLKSHFSEEKLARWARRVERGLLILAMIPLATMAMVSVGIRVAKSMMAEAPLWKSAFREAMAGNTHGQFRVMKTIMKARFQETRLPNFFSGPEHKAVSKTATSKEAVQEKRQNRVGQHYANLTRNFPELLLTKRLPINLESKALENARGTEERIQLKSAINNFREAHENLNRNAIAPEKQKQLLSKAKSDSRQALISLLPKPKEIKPMESIRSVFS